MTAPRRWVDDPNADASLRELLRGAPSARPLDPLTRRRLGARVARASALPVVVAGWLFVKSAAAALGVVLGTGAVAVATGVVEWGPPAAPQEAPPLPPPQRRQSAAVSSSKVASPAVIAVEPIAEPAVPAAPLLNPTPTLPVGSATPPNRLSAEAALLETARAKLRVAPAQALALAAQHAARFRAGQLSSERALIQVEALHRLGRAAEAQAVARVLLSDPGAAMYAERVRQLLGDEPAR